MYSAPNACFNTQPPEGGWNKAVVFAIREEVSTHSRPKAAGYAGEDLPEIEKFQHTAARRRLERLSNARYQISRFNTQPPEGGWPKNQPHSASRDCFNTQPPEGGWPVFVICHISSKKFQHTAARRRLALMDFASGNDISVSTHSRPKAAGASLKSLAPSGFAAPISLSSQEKREREYNTALSVTPAFAIS